MLSHGLSPRWRDRLGAALRGPGWRRLVLARRIAAAALAALALVLAVGPVTPAGGVPVLVVLRDLPAGVPLAQSDVAVTAFPAELAPAGALESVEAVEGRLTAGPLGAGEPVTAIRLAGPELARMLTRDPDAAVVPVRIADAGVAALLAPGSRVDVVTHGAEIGRPVVLAADAAVLTVLAAEHRVTGRLVLVAMPPETASRVAAASISEEVAVTLR